MLIIFIWHVIVHGMGLSSLKEGTYFDGNIFIYIIVPFLVPAVNCFMLISGFYGIKFSQKKCLSLVFLAFAVFWLIVSLTKYFVPNFILLDNNYLITHAFPISTKVWWFLTEYMCIMLLSPILNNGIKTLDKNKFLIILASLFTINSFGLFINKISLGSNLFSLLNLYLLGRFLAIYKVKWTCRISIASFCVSTFFLVSLLLILRDLNLPKLMWWWMSFNNPVIIIQSVSLVMLIMSFKTRHNKIGNFLGAHCFTIYLVTEKLGLNFYTFCADILQNSLLLFTLATILVIFFSLLLDYTIKSIFNIMYNFFFASKDFKDSHD